MQDHFTIIFLVYHFSVQEDQQGIGLALVGAQLCMGLQPDQAYRGCITQQIGQGNRFIRKVLIKEIHYFFD